MFAQATMLDGIHGLHVEMHRDEKVVQFQGRIFGSEQRQFAAQNQVHIRR